MLGLFCHVQVGIFTKSYFDEIVLGSIAFSCHFALDLLCDKADGHCVEARHRANIPV